MANTLWRQILLAAAGCLLLAGCTGNGHERDFNELIPRLMKPVNQYNNPTQAAAGLFNVTSPDERRDAIAYLESKSYGHQPAYMKAYKLLTTDPHAMVRAQAMRALGSSHQKEAVPYLIDGTNGKTGLSDTVAEVKRDAAQGLLETFDDRAIQALVNTLAADQDDQVRVACARALRNGSRSKEYKEAKATVALIRALDDRNAAVVYWARQSLLATTGQNMGYDAKAWLAWYQQKEAPPATQPAAKAPL